MQDAISAFLMHGPIPCLQRFSNIRLQCQFGKCHSSLTCRIQEILGQSNVDPSMNGALPPGAWWEYISTGRAPPPAEPYGVHAGKHSYFYSPLLSGSRQSSSAKIHAFNNLHTTWMGLWRIEMLHEGPLKAMMILAPVLVKWDLTCTS